MNTFQYQMFINFPICQQCQSSRDEDSTKVSRKVLLDLSRILSTNQFDASGENFLISIHSHVNLVILVANAISHIERYFDTLNIPCVHCDIFPHQSRQILVYRKLMLQKNSVNIIYRIKFPT